MFMVWWRGWHVPPPLTVSWRHSRIPRREQWWHSLCLTPGPQTVRFHGVAGVDLLLPPGVDLLLLPLLCAGRWSLLQVRACCTGVRHHLFVHLANGFWMIRRCYLIVCAQNRTKQDLQANLKYEITISNSWMFQASMNLCSLGNNVEVLLSLYYITMEKFLRNMRSSRRAVTQTQTHAPFIKSLLIYEILGDSKD